MTSTQNLPVVTKVDKSNYNNFRVFIEEAVNYSYLSTIKYSSVPISFEQSDFFNWLQADELYILNRNLKNIGFVVVHSSELDEKSLVTFTTFLHPRVCKMAAISLLRGGLCLASLYSVINKAESLSTSIYHNIMITTVRQLFPTARTVRLSELCHYCAIPFVGVSLEDLVGKLNSVFTKEEVEEYLALF
jgi:hypothetical protein